MTADDPMDRLHASIARLEAPGEAALDSAISALLARALETGDSDLLDVANWLEQWIDVS
jgi:hypothetical protein